MTGIATAPFPDANAGQASTGEVMAEAGRAGVQPAIADTPAKRLPLWHYAYFVLGALDLLTVGISLTLSHTLANSYSDSVIANRLLSDRLYQITEMSRLAQAVNAPGNDIFDSHDVAGERARNRAAMDEFNAHIEKLARSIGTSADPDTHLALQSAVERPREAMSTMQGEAENIFRNFEMGDAEAAGRRMATMDRKYAELNTAISEAINMVQQEQLSLLDAQVANAAELRRYELLIAFLMVLMVSGVMLYGHHTYKAGLRALQTEQALGEARSQAADFFDVSLDMMFICSLDTRFLEANASAYKTLGYTKEDFVGRLGLDLVHPDDIGPVSAQLAGLNQHGGAARYVVRVRRADGVYRHLECQVRNSRNLLYASAVDVTEHVENEAAAREREAAIAAIAEGNSLYVSSRSLRQALHPVLDAMLQTFGSSAGFVYAVDKDREGNILGTLQTYAGTEPGMVGDSQQHTPENIVIRIFPDDRITSDELASLTKMVEADWLLGARAHGVGSDFTGIAVVSGGELIGLVGLAESGGRIRELHPARIQNLLQGIAELLTAHRNWEQHRRREQIAERQARYDTLTQLGNRRYFVEQFAARTDHERAQFGVILIDLNRFKPINDTYGHLVGDHVLQVVSERLRSTLRGDCSVARIGGDEFAILTAPDGDRAAVMAIAHRACKAIAAPIPLDGRTHSVGASAGIAFYPGDGKTDQELLHNADAAMYRAKSSKEGVLAFDASMDVVTREKARLENRLRAAIVDGEIVPYFQPVVDMASGAVIAHEVLARWAAKEGMIPPATFIPIAESSGLIDELSWKLLRTACETAKRTGTKTMLAVNFSPLQMQDGWFAEKLLQCLAQAGFPPHRLEVEITESAMVADSSKTRAILSSLKNHGVSVALDDFGTGYSSLTTLRDLPIDKIKIDRSFVSGMLTNQADATIVKTILGMASALGHKVTAEGVETRAQAKALAELGCHYGQGYLFGKPNANAVDTIAQEAASAA